MVVIYTLQRMGFGHLAAGDWAALRSSADESLALATSLSQHALTAPPLASLTLLAALQGRDDYDTLLADLEQVVAGHPLGILTDPVHDLTRWAKGAHAAAAGDSFGALHHLSRMRLPVLGRMAACERIDAAVRAERARLGPAVGRGARRVRRRHRSAVGAGHRRVRPRDDCRRRRLQRIG